MTESTLIVCGLPGSGKTTYLAALWHLVQSQETNTALTLESLAHGDYEYINKIRKRWLRGRRQIRTVGEARIVGIDFTTIDSRKTRLLFPDHSGELFDQLWATRSCSFSVADQLRDRSGILLFLRPESIKAPLPLADLLVLEAEMEKALPGIAETTIAPSPPATDWSPENVPDQVKIVDLLQTFARDLKSPKKERLAILVSAWDLVDDCSDAEAFVAQRMPLLNQYLLYANHSFEIRYYAVSAQGGEYVKEDHSGALPEHLSTLLALHDPSSRIRLIFDSDLHHDLTLPLEWLIS